MDPRAGTPQVSADREVVCCPHCPWSAIRAGRALHQSPGWASQQLAAHLSARHPTAAPPVR